VMLKLALFDLRTAAVAVVGGGGALLALELLLIKATTLHGWWRSYAADVSREVSFLRLGISARTLLSFQVALVGLGGLLFFVGAPVLASLLAVPPFTLLSFLHMLRAKRVALIEEQLDGWLSGLASVLRATPALSEAIEYSTRLVASPLRDELDTLLKEHRLGTTLEEALVRMGDRIGSNTVQSALGTLRIGQRTGGDIPKILERSASTLREMARLEGVVRVKTAEGKAQASVLALLPFPTMALLNYLNPGFLEPLLRTPKGYVVLALAGVLWLASIIVTRRILRVDI
jgi:tight adherence protein B